jgi:hypothetical protein
VKSPAALYIEKQQRVVVDRIGKQRDLLDAIYRAPGFDIVLGLGSRYASLSA